MMELRLPARPVCTRLARSLNGDTGSGDPHKPSRPHSASPQASCRASALVCGGSRGGAFGLAGGFVRSRQPCAIRHLAKQVTQTEHFMTKTSPARMRSREARVPRRASEKRVVIPEPLQFVGETVRTTRNRTARVPTLVLRGEWLKAAGFPIGAGCYVTIDRRGEIALHRLGLGVPRRLMIVAK
jgi:hypothetical protein